ncbi:general stress protein, partial [Bacillus cereus]
KCPIGSTNNQWRMNPPLIKVSLYRSGKNENLR